MYKVKQITNYLVVFLLFINCSSSQEVEPEESTNEPNFIIEKENLTVEKKFDNESKTYYYLTRVKLERADGTLLKLKHAHSNSENGETVLNFANRVGNPTVAINASMGQSNLPEGITQSTGIQIIDGVIIQDLSISAKRNTLGIKDNNELVAYPPGISAQAILADGTNNALTAFTTLIENHEPVSEEVLSWVGNYSVKHPRQVISQFDNLDLLILSTGGRGFDGTGMTAKDVIRILQDQEVKFAFMLDGGGSVTTVIDGELITKKIDGHGKELRPRPNFLYIE